MTEARAAITERIQFPFVAVDWGTTRMRAMLCHDRKASADEIDWIAGPGISRLENTVSTTLFDAIAPWFDEYGSMRVVLAGMAGSNLGLRVAPYLACPLQLSHLSENLVSFEERGHSISIVPGVSCTNSLNQPDVMRGEEVQILGWYSENCETADSDSLLCLPGTHTKWTSVAGNQLVQFTTSLTGEVFDLLRRHSILAAKPQSDETNSFDEASFCEGVSIADRYGDDLLHAIFSVRSRPLLDIGNVGDPLSYLSGILVGSDARSALKAYEPSGKIVELVGDPGLCEKFAMAVEQLGYKSRTTDGVEAVYSGFIALAKGSVK